MKTRTYISIGYAHIVIAGLPRASPYGVVRKAADN